MFNRFNSAKCETQCRLCLGRIKLQRNKRQLQMKQHRREVAEQLKAGKPEHARIRVEAVIRENLLLEAYNILELYLELLTTRVGLVQKTKELPSDMVEAISSIIYAAQRISDFPELNELRAIFAGKYGKEYVQEAASDATCSKWNVNQNMIRCLLVEPPQPDEKLAMLSEIAQEHGIEWDLASAARDILPHSAAAAVAPAPAPAPSPSVPAPAPVAPPKPNMGGGGLPPMVYNDAATAARAAELAAKQAQEAAQFAARFAYQVPGNMEVPAPPHPGWLHDGTQQLGSTTSGGPSTSTDMGMGGRTKEDIQRAYDEAPGGPPVKPGYVPTAPGPPSPPPPPPAYGGAQLPSAPQGSGINLPAPPTKKVGPEHNEVDEYEDLAKRLDALKRS